MEEDDETTSAREGDGARYDGREAARKCEGGAEGGSGASADAERRTQQVEEELRKVEKRERGGRRAAADTAMAALRQGGGDTLEVAFLADPGRFAATHAVLVPYTAWGETGRTSKAYTATVLAEVMGGGEDGAADYEYVQPEAMQRRGSRRTGRRQGGELPDLHDSLGGARRPSGIRGARDEV